MLSRRLSAKRLSRWLLGGFFVAAGVNHFWHSAFYVGIVPPYLPWPLALVVVSGVAEIVFGALMFPVSTARLAAWGLIALSLAVFPANIDMALHPERHAWASPLALWLRLPLQFVLIGWAGWHTRRQEPDAAR